MKTTKITDKPEELMELAVRLHLTNEPWNRTRCYRRDRVLELAGSKWPDDEFWRRVDGEVEE